MAALSLIFYLMFTQTYTIIIIKDILCSTMHILSHRAVSLQQWWCTSQTVPPSHPAPWPHPRPQSPLQLKSEKPPKLFVETVIIMLHPLPLYHFHLCSSRPSVGHTVLWLVVVFAYCSESLCVSFWWPVLKPHPLWMDRSDSLLTTLDSLILYFYKQWIVSWNWDYTTQSVEQNKPVKVGTIIMMVWTCNFEWGLQT